MSYWARSAVCGTGHSEALWVRHRENAHLFGSTPGGLDARGRTRLQDMAETTNAIIEASTLPLSILIVGIGKEVSVATPPRPPGLGVPWSTAPVHACHRRAGYGR